MRDSCRGFRLGSFRLHPDRASCQNSQRPEDKLVSGQGKYVEQTVVLQLQRCSQGSKPWAGTLTRLLGLLTRVVPDCSHLPGAQVLTLRHESHHGIHSPTGHATLALGGWYRTQKSGHGPGARRGTGTVTAYVMGAP